MQTLHITSAQAQAVLVDIEEVETEIDSIAAILDPEELAFEIGAWLTGMRAFASNIGSHFAADAEPNSQSLHREFRIAHLAVRNALKIGLRLRRTPWADSVLSRAGLDTQSLDELIAALAGLSAGARAHAASRPVAFEVWQGWGWATVEMLDRLAADRKLREFSIRASYHLLPGGFRELFERSDVPVSDRVDYADIVQRVAASLRYLEIVGKMMRNDEPLKPALVILLAVYRQAREMIDHVNLRLERYEDQESPLFNSLDSASYSASLELKKVFKQELRGMIGVLPPTSVFARIETAYSLLLDSFQQILLDLARTIDPKVTLFDFFPRFQIKLDQSLILREHLWQILLAVRAAEESPEKAKVDHLKQELADFVTITIRFLHYKDEETFERFNEEVNAAFDKKDLVPVLHRFGAYLETLFGQVCMRAVLVDHPFQHGSQDH